MTTSRSSARSASDFATSSPRPASSAASNAARVRIGAEKIEGLVRAREREIFDQVLRAADAVIREHELPVLQSALANHRGLLRHALQQQAAHAGAVLLDGRGPWRQEPQVDAAALVDEARVKLHVATALAQRDRVGQVAEVPARDVRARPSVGVAAQGRRPRGARVEPLALESAQIAAGAEDVPIRVAHLDSHREMRRQAPLVEQLRVERRASPLEQRIAQRAHEGLAPPAGFARFDQLGRGIGQRHERPALLLRQCPQQRNDLLGEPARNEPFDLLGTHRAEQRARDLERDAVVVAARLEFVAQRHGLPGDLELARIPLRRDLGRLAARDVGGRHRERAVVRAPRAPGEQARPVVDVGRQPRVVELGDACLADEEISFAQARFPVEHVRPQRPVPCKEKWGHSGFRRTRTIGWGAWGREIRNVPISAGRGQRVGGERVGDEDLARLDGRHASVVDAPLAAERETEQRDDFARRDLAALRIPERIVIFELHEMRRDAQDPARIHLRDRAQIACARSRSARPQRASAAASSRAACPGRAARARRACRR